MSRSEIVLQAAEQNAVLQIPLSLLKHPRRKSTVRLTNEKS